MDLQNFDMASAFNWKLCNFSVKLYVCNVRSKCGQFWPALPRYNDIMEIQRKHTTSNASLEWLQCLKIHSWLLHPRILTMPSLRFDQEKCEPYWWLLRSTTVSIPTALHISFGTPHLPLRSPQIPSHTLRPSMVKSLNPSTDCIGYPPPLLARLLHCRGLLGLTSHRSFRFMHPATSPLPIAASPQLLLPLMSQHSPGLSDPLQYAPHIMGLNQNEPDPASGPNPRPESSFCGLKRNPAKPNVAN